MKTDKKVMEFIMSSLRSAGDIYKKGGHVTMKHRDQLFRLHYDNRRVISWESTIPSTVEKLVDSLPVECVKTCENLRFIGSLSKKKLYGKYTSSSGTNKYRSVGEIAVRNFIKGVVSTPPLFNLPQGCFRTNKLLLDFIKNHNPVYNISKESISRYKSRDVMLCKVPRTKECMGFITYVKSAFPSFDSDAFFLSAWKRKES